MFVFDCPDESGTLHRGIVCNPVVELPEGKERQLDDDDEGCLSYPGAFVECARPDRARVTGQGLDGEDVAYEGDGLLARCLQHETDHIVRHRLRRPAQQPGAQEAAQADGGRGRGLPGGLAAGPSHRATAVGPDDGTGATDRRAATARVVGVGGRGSSTVTVVPTCGSLRIETVPSCSVHQVAHAGQAQAGAPVVGGQPTAAEAVEDRGDVVGVDAAARGR